MEEFTQINIDEAKELIAGTDVTILDVRDPQTFAESHIPNAVMLTDRTIENFLKTADKTKPLICYCYHGLSSQNAALFFAENGFQKVYSIMGGFEEWRQKFPTVTE